MKLRPLIVTVAVLAVLAVVVFFLRRPPPPPSADVRIGTPVADAGALEKSVKIRIEAQAKTVLLTKQGDGTWLVPDYFGLPADFSKITQIVNRLAEAKLQRMVTSNPDRIARLEFETGSISFLDAQDKEIQVIRLGKIAEGGGRFIRFDHEPKAYLSNLSLWLDAEPKGWTDTQLVGLKTDDIAKIGISFPDGPDMTATRAKKEDPFAAENAPAGKKLNSEGMTGMLAALTTLNFTDTAALDDPNVVAAKQHTRTVKLTTFDGKTLTLVMGRKPAVKAAQAPAATPADKKPAEENKPAEPKPADIPAGPVYVLVTHSDPQAPINARMQKRAYSIPENVFTGLPPKAEDMFESNAAPAPDDKKPETN